MKTSLSVNIGKLKLKNPVMVASGTFGYAEEFSDFIDLKKLGAIVTKTITFKPRQGNPAPRTCETPAGMLNSIGLENPGLESFVREKLPFLKRLGVPIIASIASEGDLREFVLLAERIEKIKEIAAIELNISCPNIKSALPVGRNPQMAAISRRLISQDPQATYKVVKAVRRATGKTLITKLSPNVTDIAGIALAAKKAGSDALSLINTLGAMSIDIKTRMPRTATASAGLSGPAIRPVAVKMVYDVYLATKMPVIGMGGITDVSSALEFFIAGAAAVSIGTANFIFPGVAAEIIKGIERYLIDNKIRSIRSVTGSLRNSGCCL